MQDIDDDPDLGTPEALAFAIGESDAGRRLDAALAELAKAQGLALSRTRIKVLIETGALTIDGSPVSDASHKLKGGEELALLVPAPDDPEPHGEAIPLVVVYEDDHLLVIDKPAGLVVHPAPGHMTGTLVNALIAHCGASLSGIGGVRRPGIVHRIDKDTSGLLVVAKSDAAHQGLSALFADHGRTRPLERSYIAFVWGRPERPFGTVDAPVGRHATDRLRMAVVPETRGREAITHWRRQSEFGTPAVPTATRISCRLETGRTHQIRVHLTHIGHPLLGDPIYARGFLSKTKRLPPQLRDCVEHLGRQALHAAKLGFTHPLTKEWLEFESPLPADLQDLEQALDANL